VSFSEEIEHLLRLIDSGVPVQEAGAALGINKWRTYDLLRRAGRGRGPKSTITAGQEHTVVAEFKRAGSVARAAIEARVSHSTARRILVAADLVDAARGPNGKPEAKARFFELLAEGWSSAAAAREVGVNVRTARDWRTGTKRVGNTRVYVDGTVVDYDAKTRYLKPMTTAAEASIHPRFLSLDERLAIADGLLNKQTLPQIAEALGRDRVTVWREVRAHSRDGLYLPHQAHRDAAASRARPKTSKLVAHADLREQVELGLERKLSPEQISNRLKVDFPDDGSMRVSHETIYQALYFQARGGLKREVQTALRSGRARRKPQRQPDQRTHRFVDPMIMISDRPAEVEDRAVPGHWEGDLIMGEGNRSAIATLVERATRYTMLVHLPGGAHDAETVRDGLIKTIQTLPEHLRGSLTWDQGAEMARHKQFTMATDMDVYFCDPASPWQRGSNENTNGLLRQYFPKGTDLSVHGPEDLEHVAQELNGRPRKTLGWETPAERLATLLQL
jgi:transposase, IS30 family